MWKRIKNWWANLFNPKTKESTYYLVEDDEDPYTAAMLQAVMNSGKPCMGSVDEEGNMTIKVLDE